MAIEIKYPIGSKVWTMQDNRAIEVKVANWQVNGLHPKITNYYIKVGEGKPNMRFEDQLYETKELLLQSL